MEILIKRLHYTLKTTISAVYIDGKYFCDCLEDRVRTTKVYGKTAIPAGRYQVIWNKSNRFKIKMPLLLDIQGFSGVRIHVGNKNEDTDGCCIFGSYDAKTPDWVSNSRVAINKFYPLVEKAYQSNEKIWITIEDTKKPVEEPKAKVKK
jgi:hypothetical protein